MWRLPYRAFSGFVDDVITTTNSILETKRGFVGSGGTIPPSVAELLTDMREQRPLIHWEKARRGWGCQRVPVEVPLVGERTWIDVHRAPSGQADTLVVHHHGLGEIPHDLPPRLMFRINSRLRERCDWIAIKGLYHNSFEEVSRVVMRSRNTFMRNLTISAGIAKAIADARRAEYRHLVICGISLGGLVSLVENIEAPRFDLVVPFVSGPDLPDVMYNSAFTRLIHKGWLRQESRQPWLRDFDMTWRLADSAGPPIRPLLARSDRLFRYEVQKQRYETIRRAKVTSFEGGHITGAANVLICSQHLERQIAQHCWLEAAPQTEALREEPRPSERLLPQEHAA